MAINFPGPYEIRIGYTVGSLTAPIIPHVQKLNVDLVEPAAQADVFANYNFIDKDGVQTNTLATLVEDWLTAMMALFHTSTTVDFVELWKYPTAQSFDSVFWSNYVPTANVGTSAGAAVSAGQDIYTFKTQEGGTMKVSLMENSVQPGPPISLAALSVQQTAMVDIVLDGDGVNYTAPFLARDTSYPSGFGKDFPGRNEALWKKRNGR